MIIPAFNVEKYIKESLDSLERQTFKDFEAIIVDDGSKDNTVNIVSDFIIGKDNYKLLKIEHGGLSVARNTALKEVEGKYICFLDSDDLLKINTLETINDKMENNDLDLLEYGCTIFLDETNKILKESKI